MPSAVPLTPGWQSRPKDAAIGLFDRAGCPACWCAAEASESYLVSVAQETCRDASVWRDLVAARGMCPAHTRRLSGKPAAANSLTVGYFNVMRAALGDVAARPAACPGCEITDAATHHLLRYLLVDATRGDRLTYKQHGGLCLPHLRAAAAVRGDVDIRWLVRFMIVRLATAPSLDLLAGAVGTSAQGASRQVVATRQVGAGVTSCEVCQAAAKAERECDSSPEGYLCGPHLRDVGPAHPCGTTEVLAAQAGLQAARLAQVVDGRARRLGTYLPVRARRALADPACALCQARAAAVELAVTWVAGDLLRPDRQSSDPRVLCLRHTRAVLALDPQAGGVAATYLRERGQRILDELAGVGGDGADGERTRLPGTGQTGWRKAAELLDGSAFAVGPAQQR